MDHIQAVIDAASSDIASANNLAALDGVRVHFLGKKGLITAELKKLGQLPAEERRQFGQDINTAKQTIQTLLDARATVLEQQALDSALAASEVDVSAPGRSMLAAGGWHPVSRARRRLESICTAMGFEVLEGPEIESDYYNFGALNIPDNHPARAMHDTFYLDAEHVLRTHTSSVQIHAMEKGCPPLRIIAPGRVYRCDSDVTHTPMFHQIEGLVIDEGISMAHLKGFLLSFLQSYFEDPNLKIRLRSSFFPFTEPSAEVDMTCSQCDGPGSDCRICKSTGWLEVLGCGMVHPNVLINCGIDPNRYSGFAFGVGMDRMAMLRYGITDLRLLFENNLRFLNTFR